MNGLRVYGIEDGARWDEIVRTFAGYDVYYLSGYVRAFRLHGDGEPLLFFYEADGLRGINVVMRRDIAADPRFAGQLEPGRWFDFATPYGYGGWLLEGGGGRAPLFAAYEDWCAAHGIVSEFVRFHPVLENAASSRGAYEVVPLGNTIAMDLTSPEIIWEGLISQNRNKIRKAQKNGVQIRNGRTPALYETFRRLYNATMDRDAAEAYYYFGPAFYESVRNDLPQNAQVFYAELGGEIIAASIMLTANGRMNYHLSGSVQEYRNLAPTNLLLYEAALWGCANGCGTLHLGGGVGSGADSLYTFKKSFYRGEPRQYCVGKKLFLPDRAAELEQMRGALPESRFFPRYRA